jgi:hypothetical protein
MPYKPQAPPLIQVDGGPPDVYAGSPTSKKPVTPVTAVTRLLSMTLEEFEDRGRPVQVRVPGIPETIWFVPGEPDIGALAQKGIPRGRIWTARELRRLWCGGPVTQGDAQSLARIKIALDAEVISIEGLDAKEHRRDGADG